MLCHEDEKELVSSDLIRCMDELYKTTRPVSDTTRERIIGYLQLLRLLIEKEAFERTQQI